MNIKKVVWTCLCNTLFIGIFLWCHDYHSFAYLFNILLNLKFHLDPMESRAHQAIHVFHISSPDWPPASKFTQVLTILCARCVAGCTGWTSLWRIPNRLPFFHILSKETSSLEAQEAGKPNCVTLVLEDKKSAQADWCFQTAGKNCWELLKVHCISSFCW